MALGQGVTITPKTKIAPNTIIFPGAVASGPTFTHVHGSAVNVFTSVTNCGASVVGNPAVGNVVEFNLILIYSGTAPTGFSVLDSNSNSYTATTHTPLSATVNGTLVMIGKWYFLATGSPASSMSAGWTNAAGAAVCWLDEYHPSSGSPTFDKDSAGTSTTCSGTNAATPSINPTASGSLGTAVGIDPDNSFTAPTGGGVLGVWTGVAGGPDVPTTGGNAEYDLSVTGSTAVNFTCGGSGDHYVALAAAYD